MGIRLYLHPLCSSSKKVYEKIKEEGILASIEIVSLAPGHSILTDKLIPSVPALEVGGELVGVDPLEPEYVIAVVQGESGEIGKYVPHDEAEALDRFTKSFIYSSYFMILEYLSGKAIEAALKSDFVHAAIRSRYVSRAKVDRFMNFLHMNIDSIRGRVKEYLERAVAYNYLREALLVYGHNRYREVLKPEPILLWLQAKASVGRAHILPHAEKVGVAMNNARRLAEIIREREDRWVPRLLKEFKDLRVFANELEELMKARSPY